MSETAYREIRDRIVHLELWPGTPLSEEKLMRELEVGRTPIREAIKRLSLESLVDIFPRRGTFVSDIQMTDLAAISEVRREIETYGAGIAAERFDSGEDRASLQDLQIALAELDSGSVDDLMELDARVHRFVYKTAHNHFLLETLTRYYNLSFRIWHLVTRTRNTINFRVDEHVELLLAISSGDAEQARQTMRQHVIGFEAEMRAAL